MNLPAKPAAQAEAPHRRVLLSAVAAAAAALACPAAVIAAREVRVGWVTMDPPGTRSANLEAFLKGLGELGWVEGRNLHLQLWWGDNSPERLRHLGPQLSSSRLDVLVASFGAVRPLLDMPLTPPMVFAFSGDVVQAGIVQSWARPGLNRTGVSYFSLDLIPKRMQLLRELVPGLSRLAVVGWPPHPGELLELEATRQAGQQMGITAQYYGVHAISDLNAALSEIARSRVDGVLVFGGAVALNFAPQIATFCRSHRVPAVSAWASFAESGNVMSYGPVLKDSLFRLAYFVDRILGGARASEMPVELPTHIELALNLAAARSIGLDVPRTLVLRADRLIE